MLKISDKIDSNYTVSEDTQLTGIISGDVVVSNCYFRLQGIVSGSVYVESTARVEVLGIVNGTLINDGGDVSVYGVIDSLKDLDRNNPTLIDQKAIVKND